MANEILCHSDLHQAKFVKITDRCTSQDTEQGWHEGRTEKKRAVEIGHIA